MENQVWKEALKLQSEGKHNAAVIKFTRLINEEGANPDLLHDRGVSYFHLKFKKECLADFDSALNLQPDYAYRYSSRAYIRAAYKDYDGALEDYRKAVEMDPQDAVAQNNLGMLEEQMGWHEQSKERLALADELSEILQEENIAPAPTEIPTPVENQEDSKKEENSSIGQHFKAAFSIFSSKKEFNEFIQFIKNGFTFKQDKPDE